MRFLGLSILAVVLIVCQLSLTNFNLILAAVFFILFAFRFSDALWFALIAACLWELFAFAPFGLLSASLLLTALAAHFLFTYFFTNRTLLSLLILGLCGALFFRLIFLLLNLVLSIKQPADFSFTLRDYGLLALWEMLSNTLLLFVAYFITNRFSKRLKNVFLMR